MLAMKRKAIIAMISCSLMSCGSGDKKAETVEGAPSVEESLSASVSEYEEVTNLLKGVYSVDFVVESNDCSNKSGAVGAVSKEVFEVSLSAGGIFQVRLDDLIYSGYKGKADGNFFTLVRQSTHSIPPTCALKTQRVISGTKNEDGSLEGIRVETDVPEGECGGLDGCEKRESFTTKK